MSEIVRQLPIGPRRLLLCFAIACAVLGGTAEANWEDHCPELRIRGPVASITEWGYRVDRKTGTSIGDRRKISETTVSPDRRTVTEVIYDADSPIQIKLQMFPTTVFEYDGNGRLITHTLKLDGQEVFTVKRCQYDATGRVSSVAQQSKNPDDDNRKTVYAYGDGWRRQQWQSPWATVVTTQHLDALGRPVRETRIHVTFSEKHERTFEYSNNTTKICYVDSDRMLCTSYRYDAHGNEVDSRSDRGFRAATYEYDSYGNWTVQRVESAATGGVASFRNIELRRREITYNKQP